MAIILLACILIVTGLQRILPAFNTATINVIIGVAMIIDGILFIVAR